MNWYSRDNYVLSSEGDTTTEICQANSADNARFISAAPELLEVLENLLFYTDRDRIPKWELKRALDAIAKAKGV